MLDCIIVGTGPAGLSAALNLQTYKKDFLWFGSEKLSEKLIKAEKVTNYPGIPNVTGEELFASFSEHVKEAGLTITAKTVTNIMHMGESFSLLADNDIYEAKTIILATGVMSAKLIAGEEEYLGRGVSYCATCDGRLYQGKRIAVVCNAPKYEHEVEFLADLASEVIYFPTFESSIHRDNVTTYKEVPVKISGGFKVQALERKNGEVLDVDGVFCLRDAIAPTSLLPGLEVEKGHIVVNRKLETNLPGCFAAGDCTGRPYQYTKAVGEGNVAAHSVIEYLAKTFQNKTEE